MLRGDGDRRDFFRNAMGEWVEQVLQRTGSRVSQRRYDRPPGALPEVAFLAACTRCGECVKICPPKAIITAPTDAGLAAGTPYIDARFQPCTVCPDMPCVTACPTGALTLPPGGWSGYRLGSLKLDPDRCIAFHGTACGVCARHCPVGERALALDEGGRPIIRVEGCVGCGVCVRACVTTPSSLALTPLEE